MSEARTFHRQAMEYLAQADMAQLKSNKTSARTLLKKSLELEEQAANFYMYRFEIEPTRSQLYKGAAIIAIRLKDWRRAEKLVSFALAGDPPPHNAEALRNILEDIHFTRHILDTNVQLSDDEIDITVAGEAIGYGIADKDEVFRRVEALQNLFVRAAERRREIPFRRRGQPSPEVTKDVQLFLATPRAASFGVKIKLGSDQGKLPGMSESASLVQDTLNALQAFSSNQTKELEVAIPEASYLQNFVTVARELLPDGRKVKAVHLSSDQNEERKTVSLTRRRRDKSEFEPKQLEGERRQENSTVILIGEIRAMDSREEDEYVTVLTSNGPEKLHVPGEKMDALTYYYKNSVRVTARREGKRLTYVDVDRIESEDS